MATSGGGDAAIDLKEAGIDYRDTDGSKFDFHAHRHQYIPSLSEAGVHPRTAQQLARHSTIELTMKRYTHLTLSNVAGAVESIPEPRPAGDHVLVATGTDERRLRAECGAGDSKRGELAMRRLRAPSSKGGKTDPERQDR